MKRRLAFFLLGTFAGMCIGILGDFFTSEPIHASDILSAILMSPIVVTVGGKAVTFKVVANVFFVGGLLFVPGYVLLLWLCLRRAASWASVGAFIWCAQGYFQVVHRLWAVMSV